MRLYKANRKQVYIDLFVFIMLLGVGSLFLAGLAGLALDIVRTVVL